MYVRNHRHFNIHDKKGTWCNGAGGPSYPLYFTKKPSLTTLDKFLTIWTKRKSF